MLTIKQQQLAIKSIIDSGELDLGFCKLVKIRMKGGKARSYNTIFKRKDHWKLGVRSSKELREEMNK